MTLIRRERIAEKLGQKSSTHFIATESEKQTQFNAAEAGAEPAGRVFNEAPDFSYLKDNAQKEARQLLNSATTQAEEIKNAAHEEGLLQGKNEGLAQLQSHIKEALKLIEQANVERKKIIEQSSQDILNLSLQVAAKLTHSEITSRPEVLMDILKEATNKISDRDQVTIKVNSADLEFIKSKREQVEDLIDGVKKLNIIADKKVGPGGFIIETQMGYVDARLETKMTVIEEAFSQIEMEDRRALESPSEKYDEKSEQASDLETEEGEDMNRKKPYLDEDEQEKLDGGFEDEEEEKTEEEEAFEDEDLNLDDLDLDKMEE